MEPLAIVEPFNKREDVPTGFLSRVIRLDKTKGSGVVSHLSSCEHIFVHYLQRPGAAGVDRLWQRRDDLLHLRGEHVSDQEFADFEGEYDLPEPGIRL